MPAAEIDQYPAAATPRAGPPGELPPGNAVISFITASLDSVTAPFLASPVRHAGALYAGRRSAVVRGTAIAVAAALVLAGSPPFILLALLCSLPLFAALLVRPAARSHRR
jgi:hypothetical protein